MTQINKPIEVHYKEITQDILTKDLQTEAKLLIQKNNYSSRLNWLKGLAICAQAVEKNQLTEEVKTLYLQLYREHWNLYFSSSLVEEDYNYWFNLSLKVNQSLIEIGYNRAYAEKSYIYETARRPHKNQDIEREALLQGIDNGDIASMAIRGYNLFFGVKGETENQEEGKKLILQSKELGYDYANSFLLILTYYTETNNAKILEAIQELMQNNNKKERPYNILAEYYLYKEENLDQALQVLEQGVEQNNGYCKYLLGISILNDQYPDKDKEQGIALLEDAYTYGIINAANWLGRFYNYNPEEKFKSIEKSIQWHEKAKLYYNEDSLVELALSYLYESKSKDEEKGLIYLDWAIQEKSIKALSEKAHYLLNEEEPNYPVAQKLLEEATEKGDSYAPYRLGLMYERGNLGEPNYYKAFELYRLSAERGHLYGIELVGNYYRTGITKREEGNPEKAIEYLNKAISLGSDYAKIELALCHETGFGTEQDYKKAYQLYKQAADNNYPYAFNKVGYYEEDGLAGEANLEKAFQYFQKSAEAGYPEGIYNVGRAYRYSIGVPENPELALEYFNKAAEDEYADAFIELALAYENEYGGLEFDAERVLEYMTIAAEQGIPFAQYKTGYYHYYGLVETNLDLALEWLHKSYNSGYPHAALLIGDYYLYNESKLDEPEYDKAFDYYKMAESQDVVSEGLGICYEFGIGTEENLLESFKNYLKGAERGYNDAKYRLAMAYKLGTGTEADPEEAYRWMKEAAQANHHNAQYQEALMLLNGEGTTANPEEAVVKLTQTAEKNHSNAQYELGNCYLMGKGVEEDEVQAMMWYQKAADNGHEQAQKVTGKRDRKK